MAEPRPQQGAARLSEDIGDVLGAIRRLLAEDDAFIPVRDDDHSEARDTDIGSFLANRHGGNASLARRLVASGSEGAVTDRQPPRVLPPSAAVDPDADVWPLGGRGNAADASRPRLAVAPEPAGFTPGQPRIQRHDTESDQKAAGDQPQVPVLQNGLARSLSERIGGKSADRPAQQSAPPERIDFRPVSAETRRSQPWLQIPTRGGDDTRLRLDAARRVVTTMAAAPGSGSEGQGGIRPEPPLSRPDLRATAPAQMSREGVVATASPDCVEDFAEALDWKARMRPVLEEPSACLANTAVTAMGMPRAKPAEPAGGDAIGRAPTAPGADPAGLAPLAPLASPSGEAEGFADVIAALDRSGSEGDMATPTGRSEADHPPLVHDTITGLSPEAEEQSIRDLLREMIREELHGELGERFSRNLRAVIRREVAAAIDDQLERF
ncbi:hypothetical protein [Paracoccus marinaquae]|uniref:Uncharacterized protein n=1 Tax=Paracoccus marinaquae TaxID=2841926 RepID=A0ABS6AH54_9RHOB|nr:hypothetical protein [Paracoccus marinaquae]MBU3029924.1 hypothetical protein [Paracoccus marinaquae]